MRIPVVLSTDHKYLVPTGVTIHSLVSSGEVFDIYVICDSDVSEDDKKLIRAEVLSTSSLSTINFLSLNDTFKESHTERHLSRATYARMLIPELLPDFDKIIYCDSDMIFNIKLSPLFKNITLTDKYCAAVRIRFDKKNESLRRDVEKIGLNPANYVNAGFLVLNCKLIREDKLTDKFIELSKNKFTYMDQDIINILFENRIEYIEGKYNVPDYRITPEMLSGEYAVHYVGSKPWNTFKPCWIIWWNEYRKTGFFDIQSYFKVSDLILENLKEGEKAKQALQSFPHRLFDNVKTALRSRFNCTLFTKL